MEDLRWIPVLGEFEQDSGALVFKGAPSVPDEKVFPSIGNALCNRRFSGGRLAAEIQFTTISDRTACELMLNYNPATRAFVTAGIGGLNLFSIRHFFNQWSVLASTGDRANLTTDRPYTLAATVRGSQILLNVDGVDVLQTEFPVALPESQVGVWCHSESDIFIRNFSVESRRPRVFVVMQYSSPFNEIYIEVIQTVCRELGIDAIRADETYGPGIVVEDMVRQIVDSQAIIADISLPNPNVYYEVGYAHALRKPTILLADRSLEKLPFDVSPFRVLFYENSIPGRSRFEDGLRKHLTAIFTR